MTGRGTTRRPGAAARVPDPARETRQGPGVRGALLGRVRSLFVLLVAVVLVVELIELADARTPWWPHRLLALAALLVAAWWARRLHRRGSSMLALDLVPPAAVLVVGLGLGRHGAVLALLIGASQHRALYGSRRSVAVAVGALLAAYLAVGLLQRGPTHLLDLGNLVVAVGIAGIAMVMRLVAETLAWHDVTAAWDGILTDAAADLLSASGPGDIGTAVDQALRAIADRGAHAAGGLWSRPIPEGAIPRDHRELAASGARTWGGHRSALDRTLRRLATDAATARERLESEHRYRLLAERSRDGIYVLELGDRPAYRYLNPEAERVLGLDASAVEADARLTLGRIHPEDHDLIRTARAGTGAFLEPIQMRVCREDGTTTWVEVAESVIASRDGRPHLVQGVVRDVTRRHAQEEALQRALAQEQAAAEELRQLDEMKSTFLQAVSHELRTPLTAVLGSAETLRDRHRDLSPDDADLLLQAVARQAGRLRRLLDDLLDVDRLSRGLVVAERAPTHLQEVVARAIDGLGEHRDRFQVAIDPIVADLDAAQVERIVENLLRNAIKHTPAGTGIRLTGRTHAGVTVLTVEDDGEGVPEALRSTIFEPFVQGLQTGGSAPGTGIGLALVRQLAELHGGEAWVEEASSGGARFVVVLPGAPRREGGEPDGGPSGGQRGLASPATAS